MSLAGAVAKSAEVGTGGQRPAVLIPAVPDECVPPAGPHTPLPEDALRGEYLLIVPAERVDVPAAIAARHSTVEIRFAFDQSASPASLPGYR